MLSKFCSNITNEYCIKIGGVNKLVQNVGSKNKYVLHYKFLQLYLSLEMNQLVFIEFENLKNTNKGENIVNGFEKDVLKLMNNRVYGKTMKHLWKRVKVRFVNNAKDFFHRKYLLKVLLLLMKLNQF